MRLIAGILIGGLLHSLLGVPVYAGTSALDCSSRTNDLACAIFVSRVNGVAVLTKPDDMAEVSSRLVLAQAVRINWKLTNTLNGEWMYVGMRSGHLNDISPVGWVRAKYLAAEADFIQVTNCWPFSSVFDDTQVDGPELDVKFSRHGRSVSGKIKVWSAGTLIRIGSSLRNSLVYGYDPATRKLFYAGSEPIGPRVTLFDPPVLQSCRGLQTRR